MSAFVAPSASPSNALLVWCDARRIYIELPTSPRAGPDLAPCIMTFTRDSLGLAKALSIVFGHADNSSAMPENFRPGRKLIGTPTQHAQAQAILRRRGMVK